MIHRLLHCGLWLLTWVLMPFLFFGQKNPQTTRELLRSDLKVKSYTFNDQLGTPSFISYNQNSHYRSADALPVLKKYFALEAAGNEIRLLSTDELKSGVRVDRYKLFFNGVKVEHSSYVIISHNDKIISVNAESYSLGTGFSVVPSLSVEGARTKALSFVNARKYAWQALDEDKAKAAGNLVLQQQYENLKQQYFPNGELVIAKDVYGDGQAKLAWKFDIYATEPVSRNYVYVDAINGKIILRDAIIKHADEILKKTATPIFQKTGVPEVKNNFLKYRSPDYFNPPVSFLGSGQTRYAGTRNIYTTKISVPLGGTTDPNNTAAPLTYSGVDPRVPIVTATDVYILKDDTRGGGVETYDMNGVGGLPLSIPALQSTSLAFVDKDNIWKNETLPGTNEDLIRGATSDGTIGPDEASNDDYALDAHWGAEMVYDYWKAKHGRLSFDNRNSAIKSYVHYGPAYDNAFWNGSVMTYGDGSGTTALGFRPLTSLDVCGHEIGHGVCSFTADLVYERESGAMNEALSDIWASCIEHFVKTTVDNTLPYQSFQVGEQISADNVGLRRMDNPKAKGDPDTYGGVNWKDPNCVPEQNTNDNCGVHTNSGVLNKWFYFIVQGPLTTTGAPVAFTDDGKADLGAVADGGNVYAGLGSPVPAGEFVGLGFDQAEAIVYLMELSLTPNATYAEARTASINAAKVLYGECSQAEKTITDAWFAVNVGARYAGCSAPLLSVQTAITNITEGTSGDCVSYNEYTISTNLTTGQGSAVTINFSVTGGTATSNDFALSASSITYNVNEAGLKSIQLRVYADAMVESSETIQITASSASPVLNQVFTFTVADDDIDATIGGTVTLLNQDFESTATTTVPAGWSTVDKITPSPVKWEVETYQSGALTWSGKRAIIELTATSPTTDGIALYDQTPGHSSSTVLKTPLINTTGLNSIRVQFVYNAGGEGACDPACDYGKLVYSFDGTNFNDFTAEVVPLFLQPTDATFDYILPSSFNGKQFYLGIVWTNDDNAGTSASITIDNFVVTAKGRGIENELGATVSARVPAETGKPVYFNSTQDGELITRVVNNTVHDYGCVSATIEKTGNSTFNWYSDGINSYKTADKIVKIVPATNNSNGSYTVYLYFTEAQIAALETASGTLRNTFKLHHTTASAYTGANGGNTVIAATTNYTSISGVGGVFSSTFTNGLAGSFALAAQGSQAACPAPVVTNVSTKSGSAANVHSLTGVSAGALLVLTTTNNTNAAPYDCIVTSSPSLTWTKRTDAGAASSNNAEIWTAVYAVGGNITVTSNWGSVGQASVLYTVTGAEAVLSGASGTGTSQAAPSVAITTTRANSILFGCTSDWNGIDGATRTLRDGATDRFYFRDASKGYTAYYYTKATTSAGPYTEGVSSPTGQKASTAVLEIRCPGTTAPDVTAPTIISVSPVNNATGVPVNTTVTATFSEAMNAATINGTTFELRNPSSVLVAATVSYNAGTNTATLTPSSALANSTTYTAKVIGGAPGVKDVAGNPMAGDYTWSFTTAAAAPACQLNIVSVDTKTNTSATVHSLTGVSAGALLVLTTTNNTNAAPYDCIVTSSRSLTWTKRTDAGAASSNNAEIWTAVYAVGGNITVTSNWGAVSQVSVLYTVTGAESVLSGASGTGTSQTAPSVAVTTTRANSILFGCTSDWNGINGATRTLRDGATDRYYFRDAAKGYTAYYYTKATTSIGTYTEGVSSPTGQKASTAVLEIRCPGAVTRLADPVTALTEKRIYNLGQNYPNPVTSETTIQFTLPKAEKVNLSLYDINGRVVKVLVNGSRDAGTHTVSFNAGSLAGGVYYYRMQAGDFIKAKKLTIQQ